MGKECATEGDCQRKFTRIHSNGTRESNYCMNDSRANFRARKIYLVWDYVSGRTNRVQHNSRA